MRRSAYSVVRRILGLSILGTLIPAMAGASVAWRPIYGGRGMGMGGATVATADDETACIINPALLTEVKGGRVDAGTLTFYHPDGITFRRQADSLSPAGYPRQSTTNSASTVPFAGFVLHPKDSRFAFGVGINVPFAEDLRWSKNGPGRYWATSSQFSFVYVTPAAAFEVNDKLSLGLGLDVVRFDGEVRTKLDFGALGGTPEKQSLDGDALLEGDGTGVGANLGILIHPVEKLDIGLSYLSPVSFTANGTRSAAVPLAFQQALGLPPKIEFTREKLEVRMPQLYRLGAAIHPSHHVTIAAEIQELDRHNEKFLLKNAGSTRPDVLPDSEEQLVPVPFKTALSYKLGGEYHRERWAVRLGALVDENGVADGSMSPAGVDTRKLEATAGFGFRTKHLLLDMSYARVFGDPRHVTDSQVVNRLSGVPANGDYEIDTNIVTLAAGFRF